YSLADESVTWKAASGFLSPDIDYQKPVQRPLAAGLARDALFGNSVVILEGIGLRPDLPPESFPAHVAEGVHDMAIAPLTIYGNHSGALTAGYRKRHYFTDDEQRLIIRCNARAAEMIEMRSEEVVGMLFDDAFSRLVGDEQSAYYLTQNRDARSAFEAQTQGGRRYLVSISSLQRPGGETVSVAGWNDVTRLSEVQEQLARSRRLGSVGQLAAGVAHEINNPLAAIATCAEAIMRDLRRLESLKAVADEHQWPYYLEEIVRQALRCKDITRGLLDLTQQRHAKRTLCDINMIARQCAKVAVQQAESTSVEFAINLDEDMGEVATDAAMVRQVLDNLLSNAVDALGEKGGRITISTAREGDRALIEVADNGHGIPPDLVSRVFDRFVSTKGAGKNYGLGLAICAALAESMGGALTVES